MLVAVLFGITPAGITRIMLGERFTNQNFGYIIIVKVGRMELIYLPALKITKQS